jgi:hypothetical protein
MAAADIASEISFLLDKPSSRQDFCVEHVADYGSEISLLICDILDRMC